LDRDEKMEALEEESQQIGAENELRETSADTHIQCMLQLLTTADCYDSSKQLPDNHNGHVFYSARFNLGIYLAVLFYQLSKK